MSTTTNPQSLKTLTLIHLALLAGQTMFLAVVIFLNFNGSPNDDSGLREVLQYVVPLLALAAISTGQLIFKSLINSIKTKNTYKEQFALFQSACLIKWATLEGPSLFAIVSYFLTGGWFFVAIAVSLMIIQALDRPTQEKIDRYITAIDLKNA